MTFHRGLGSLLLVGSALALDNGFGRTPVMGFNTYNDVGCSPNQTHIYNTMDALIEKGFLAAGYNFFQVDCGWQGYDRQANGSITYDADSFPDGIASLSKAAIEKGFEWSMYTNQGVYSCDTETPAIRQGSLGHEREDALQLAGWNVAYMKVGPFWQNVVNDNTDSVFLS
jgi:alpha-galactosidase